MPTFHDPLADAAEAREALRALAHASRSFEDPADTYAVTGDLLGALRSLAQVLDQVAAAHSRNASRAHTDNGHHEAGVEQAHLAAAALRQSASLVRRAEPTLDQASQHSSRIAWTPAPDRRSPSPERAPLAPFSEGRSATHHEPSKWWGVAL